MWQAEKTVFRGRHAVLCPEPLLCGNRALPVLVHHCIVPPFPGSIGSYGVPQGEEWGPWDDLFRVIGNGSRCVSVYPSPQATEEVYAWKNFLRGWGGVEFIC